MLMDMQGSVARGLVAGHGEAGGLDVGLVRIDVRWLMVFTSTML